MHDQKSYQRLMFLLTVGLPVFLTAVMLTVFTFNKGYKLLEPLLCSDGAALMWEDGPSSEYYIDGEWRISTETYIYCVEPGGLHGTDHSLLAFSIYLSLSIVIAVLIALFVIPFRNLYYKRQWEKYQGGGESQQ